MSKRFIAMSLCATLGLIGANGFAKAETIGRYECSVVGPLSQEPIGDRDGHRLMSFQYSCLGVDGLLKGAIATASTILEWDGPHATFLSSFGTHRAAGGFAVIEAVEGTGSLVMSNGKPVGTESSGKSVVKFASGTLAALSGKTVKFASKPMGFGRFTLEFTD
jgi:hypothetical protein